MMFSIGTITLTRRLAIRILSVLLILVFLLLVTISPIVTAKAFAATLTVVGTVALTMATIASIYMICAGASGMDGAVRNQARATGTQPLDYMGQLLNRWLSATGVLPATLATKFQQGFSYLPDGTLFLDNDCTEAVADFQRWAWDEDGANLIDFAPISESSDGILTDASGVQMQVIEFANCELDSNGWYRYPIGTANSGSMTFYFACESPIKVVAYIYHNNSYWLKAGNYAPVDGSTAYHRYSIFFGNQSGLVSATLSSGSDSVIQVGGSFGSSSVTWYLPVSSVNITSFDSSNWSGGSDVVGDPNTFYGPAQQNQGTQIAAGSAVTVSPEAAANLHIANYLRAMAAAYAGTGVADVPVTDTGTGEEETLPLSVPLDTPLTVTGISDSAIDQSGSVAVSDSVAADFTGLDDYTMDLTRFFPFCIPFDLAALFQKFEAEAAAPVVDIPFPNPADPEGTPLSVHVDLTPFDELAAVVRKLELVAFVIGLCFLTKRLIQGGD